MSGKLSIVYALLSVVMISSGQQIFQKKGEHYTAKVAIHREKPYSFNSNVGVPRQRSRHTGYQRQSWRQGDRITKEEVAHNLARALLSHKMTAEEIENERRKDNKEKLHEYAIYEARMAKAQRAPLANKMVKPYPALPQSNNMPQRGNGQYNRPPRLPSSAGAKPREFMKPNAVRTK